MQAYKSRKAVGVIIVIVICNFGTISYFDSFGHFSFIGNIDIIHVISNIDKINIGENNIGGNNIGEIHIVGIIGTTSTDPR